MRRDSDTKGTTRKLQPYYCYPRCLCHVRLPALNVSHSPLIRVTSSHPASRTTFFYSHSSSSSSALRQSTNLVRWALHSRNRRLTPSFPPAPEATQFGEHTVTQKHLYTGLFVIGIPLLWLSSPIGTFFWLVGASGVLILGHACMLEPGVESDYAAINETQV